MSEAVCSLKVTRALGAFDDAQTVQDYKAAKRQMARLEPLQQMAMIDSMLASRKRVGL